MSIETEFESTITNVKNAYQGLDNLGATIPQNKTIENIKSCLDEIYNNLPKTSYAEGSNITLSNTLKGKLDFEDGIVGIGDTSQIQYNGYNLWGGFNDYSAFGFTTKSDGTILVTLNNQQGTSATTNVAITNGLLKTLPAGNYMFTAIGLVENLMADIVKRTPNTTSGQVIKEIKYGEPIASQFTLTEESEVFVRLNTNGNVTLNGIVYLQVEKGSTAHDWEPYVGGTASPNPSYPQDIEVVRGKNIFDKDNANIINSYFLQTDPTISASGNTYRSIYIECKPNTIYTISKVSSARFCIGYTTTTPAVGVSVLGVIQNNTATSITITTGSNAKYLVAFIYHSSYDTLTPQQIYDSIQIEKGSQATSYLPYNTLEARIRGKNYAKLDQSINNRNADITYIENVANSVVGSKTSNNGQFLATFVAQVVSGQTYIISGTATNCNLYAYKETLGGEPFANISSSTLPKSFTSNYTGTIVLGMFFPSAITGTASIKNFQLEEGSTATAYEPYITPITHQLSLGEYEFAKIGNYVDMIEYDVDEDKVYKNENVNEHIFTENENISLQSINSYGIANFFISHSLGSVSNFALCNYFTLQTSGISVTQEEGFLWQHNGVYFRIKSSTASDVSSFKTWLGSHNTKVKYALAEAVKKPITGTLKDQIKALYYSHSFTGTTIIEIDGQLPLIIKVRALKGN